MGHRRFFDWTLKLFFEDTIGHVNKDENREIDGFWWNKLKNILESTLNMNECEKNDLNEIEVRIIIEIQGCYLRSKRCALSSKMDDWMPFILV